VTRLPGALGGDAFAGRPGWWRVCRAPWMVTRLPGAPGG